MEIATTLFIYIVWILLSFITFCSFYLAVLGIFGSKLLYRSPLLKYKNGATSKTTLKVLVPAYKNDAVLLDTCKRNLEVLQQVQHIHFEYWVLADRVQEKTVSEIKELGCKVFTVQLENPTKSRAINQWLEAQNTTENCYLFLLDVDNLLTIDNLEKGLLAATNNTQAWWQFKRTAANENSDIAGLDAWSEAVNNAIFRRGAKKVGIRPALIGSGMIAPMQSFQKIHHAIDVTGGFDKWVEHFLMKEKIKVVYVDEIHILDQKIAAIDALKKQRTRWVAAQLLTAKKLFGTFVLSIFTFRWANALKYFQLFLPPRVLHLAFSLFALASFFLNPLVFKLALLNMAFLASALIFATPRGQHFKVFKLMLSNGFKLIFNYLSMTKNFGEANKKFLVTEHKTPNDENRN